MSQNKVKLKPAIIIPDLKYIHIPTKVTNGTLLNMLALSRIDHYFIQQLKGTLKGTG